MKAVLDLVTAVEFIENSLNSGRNGFFVNTEFGVIGVEIDNGIMYDPMTPVVVIPWVHAPRTSWSIKNMNRHADFYMSIDTPESRASIHLNVVEAVLRCMINHILGFDPDSRIIDSAVMLYEKHICNKVWTVNALEKEFVKVNLGIIVRNDRVVKMLVRDMITRRIIDAEEIIGKSEKLLDAYGDIGNNDDYFKAIFGLMIYTVKRFPERKRDVNKSLLDLINKRKDNESIINFNKKAVGGI